MNESRSARASATKETVSVRITQQFRERNNMTYELDCSGTPLVLRIFFPEDTPATGDWRIEARTGQGLTATASAPSRPEALQTIARDWPRTSAASDLDWAGITRAMSAVRAI